MTKTDPSAREVLDAAIRKNQVTLSPDNLPAKLGDLLKASLASSSSPAAGAASGSGQVNLLQQMNAASQSPARSPYLARPSILPQAPPPPTRQQRLDDLLKIGYRQNTNNTESIARHKYDSNLPVWTEEQAEAVRELLGSDTQVNVDYILIGVRGGLTKTKMTAKRANKQSTNEQYRVPYPRFDNFPYEVLPSLHWYDVDG
eukprot:jgi/Mesvir1/26375/Mv23105-RA.1